LTPSCPELSTKLSGTRHRSLAFSLAWLPPTPNRMIRGHWTLEYRAVKTAALYILAAIGKPHCRPVGRPKVTIRMFRRVPMRDPDNARFASEKVILDALVRLGWLENDDGAHVEAHALPPLVDRRRPRTEIRLEGDYQ
jgi:hypothetical protein